MILNALVVDDSGIMRKMVMKSLTEANLGEFAFTEATDGEDALTKFDPRTIDICFVDWNMPKMTGIEFVRAARAKIREIGNCDDTPLIMVTSEKTMGKVQEALDEAGADAFISKPFTADELSRKLKKIVEEAQALKVQREREAVSEQEEQPKKGFFSKLFG